MLCREELASCRPDGRARDDNGLLILRGDRPRVDGGRGQAPVAGSSRSLSLHPLEAPVCHRRATLWCKER